MRAADAEVDPVPPFATAIAVPVQLPVVIVPRVVTLVVPAQVLKAVFSTLLKPISDLTSDADLPSTAVPSILRKSSSATPVAN